MLCHKKLFKSFAIISISTLGLISCTPSFQTTAEKCSTYSPVTLPTEATVDNSEFKVLADRTSNNYKLHLEDALNSLNLENLKSKSEEGETSPISEDERAAIQFVLDKAKEKMGYVIKNGKVESASNPLDYVESLFAATDEAEVIQTFVDAKRNLAQAISSDNSTCSYINPSINLIIEDPNIPSNENNVIKTVNTQLSLNYNPYSKGENKDTVDQIFLISLYDEPIIDLDISKRKAKSFSGITRIADTEFKAEGASLPKIRQINYSDSFINETFFFDDDFSELKLGQLVTTLFNATCKDETTGEEIACTDPGTTRIPQHDACNGGVDDEGNDQTDENNKYQEKYLPVVAGHPVLDKVQRLRLEVDYPKNEIRLYASNYAEKILTAEGGTITNPTRCEQQAVLTDLDKLVTDEERNNPDFEGVRLTLVGDPNYDLIEIVDTEGKPVLDEDGNPTYYEPNAIFVFEGTVIEGRQ
jgi:hypothetical protein